MDFEKAIKSHLPKSVSDQFFTEDDTPQPPLPVDIPVPSVIKDVAYKYRTDIPAAPVADNPLLADLRSRTSFETRADLMGTLSAAGIELKKDITT